MGKHLIETTYEYAKENFGRTPFTFKELYNALVKKDSSVKESSASDLYIELLQDIRFISLGKQKWSLREYFTLSEINKITSSMFGLDEYYENDIEGYIPVTKPEEEEPIEDFIDDEDNGSLDSQTFFSEEEIVDEDEITKSANLIVEKDSEEDDNQDLIDEDDFIIEESDDEE